MEDKMSALPFAGLTSLELRDLFETGSDKLKNISNDSKLPNHLKQLIPYYARNQLLRKVRSFYFGSVWDLY